MATVTKRKTVKAASAKPTGLTATRSGNKFTVKWKFGEKNYDKGQEFAVKVTYASGKESKWSYTNISKSAKSASWTFPASSYFPTAGKVRVKQITFAVRGTQKDWQTTTSKKSGKTTTKTITTHVGQPSAWSYVSYAVYDPKDPVMGAARSETLSNVATFSWSTPDTGANYWGVNSKWESQLVKESGVTDGSKLSWNSSKLGWMSATGQAMSGSREITENTALLAANAYTRWFRAATQGPRGWSNWRYARLVYGTPFRARNVTANASVVAAGGYLCTVRWVSDANPAHPIDKTTVQYAMATPTSGLGCPDGASWTDGRVIRDTGGADAASFPIDNLLSTDQCLFVRVNNEYAGIVTYGVPVLADVGKLADPSGLSVETNEQTHKATITATNNSQVPDSFLEVRFCSERDPAGTVVAIIPNGQTTVTGVQCPNWTALGLGAIGFAVRAVAGSYRATPRADGVGSYAVTARMVSQNIIRDGGQVPVAPDNVSVSATTQTGTIRVEWDWTWEMATSAVISWADHEDAWESTDEPETYTVSNLFSSAWNISGLETGKTWYVRVKLVSGTGENETAGPWSDMQSIDLASAPAIPVLALSQGVITQDGSVTASWVYSTTDGSGQAFAEIAEYIQPEQEGDEATYIPLVQVETAQTVTLDAQTYEWQAGETHALVVRVRSASGRLSDAWSDPVSVIVAEPLEITIASTSLVEETETIGDVTRTFNALKVMPLTVTVYGAGVGGQTSVVIERADGYDMARPDEDMFNGFAGETIAIQTITGEGQFSFGRDSLIGHLDDGAKYRIIATIQDGLGQSAEQTIDFEVSWTQQALIPEAAVTVDEEQMIAILTPVAPTGVGEGDVCDIYRLSVDKPQLIVEGAEWGTQYVDPYPTLGEFGGHRFVYRTIDGDYITEDQRLAWTDLGSGENDYIYSEDNVIDFPNGRVALSHNIDLSNKWSKDFTETKYLGGSIQGDWNPAVSRSSSLKGVIVATDNPSMIETMRRLAVYPGICHIRTLDGSSYAANVDVSEDYNVDSAHKIVSFSLDITRVDNEELDGMTLEEWNNLNQEEEA